VKLLLFDVDQTLVNTGGAGIRALNRAFKQVLGVDNAMDGIAPHGKTDPGIIREIGASRNVEVSTALGRILDFYLTYLQQEVETSSSYRVLPGILSILGELAGHPHVALGLATGNVERGARMKLERGDLNGYFTFGGYGSDSEERPELVRRAAERAAERIGREIRAKDVFVIGDTPRDIEAAHASGFQAVGVATGRYSVADLTESHPEVRMVVADFETGREQFLDLVAG
jgi:phosphoglycolate phosphatase-like HAD superfamily hydrolase